MLTAPLETYIFGHGHDGRKGGVGTGIDAILAWMSAAGAVQIPIAIAMDAEVGEHTRNQGGHAVFLAQEKV